MSEQGVRTPQQEWRQEWRSVQVTPPQAIAIVKAARSLASGQLSAAQAEKLGARATALLSSAASGYLVVVPGPIPPDRVLACLRSLAGSPAPVTRQFPVNESVWAQLHQNHLTTGHTASTYSPAHPGTRVTAPVPVVSRGENLSRRLAEEDRARYDRKARQTASASAQYEQARARSAGDAAAERAAEVRLEALRAAIRAGLEAPL